VPCRAGGGWAGMVLWCYCCCRVFSYYLSYTDEILFVKSGKRKAEGRQGRA